MTVHIYFFEGRDMKDVIRTPVPWNNIWDMIALKMNLYMCANKNVNSESVILCNYLDMLKQNKLSEQNVSVKHNRKWKR